MRDEELTHLRQAIELAKAARARGNGAFGAVLAGPDGQVLMAAENDVTTSGDPTGHAETKLLREACRIHTREFLGLCTLYSSTEPCAMCAGTIFWSGLGRVVFALSSATLYERLGPGGDQLDVRCREVLGKASRPIVVEGPFIEDEAFEPFEGLDEGRSKE